MSVTVFELHLFLVSCDLRYSPRAQRSDLEAIFDFLNGLVHCWQQNISPSSTHD